MYLLTRTTIVSLLGIAATKPTESLIIGRTNMYPSSMIGLIGSNKQQQRQPKRQLQERSKSTSLHVKAMFSFTDARRIARNYQFDCRGEYMEYSCPGAYQLPKNPENVWADEWKGWEDWLGIRLDFEAGREAARALYLTNMDEYMQLISSKTIDDDDDASRLPFRPDKVYKDEWKSWEDWLGVQG